MAVLVPVDTSGESPKSKFAKPPAVTVSTNLTEHVHVPSEIVAYVSCNAAGAPEVSIAFVRYVLRFTTAARDVWHCSPAVAVAELFAGVLSCG